MRFSTRNGVGEVKGDQAVAKQCLVIQDKQSDGSRLALDQLALERTIFVSLQKDNPARSIQIESLLDEETKMRLIDFLWSNADIFAWSASDMPGIPPEVMTHHLNVIPTYVPVR